MSRIINKRCETCDKVIKYSNYWNRHCQTKKHLRNKEMDKTDKVVENLEKTGENLEKMDKNLDKMEKMDKTLEKMDKTNIELNNIINKKYKCKFCNKNFKHKKSKIHHEKLTCKKRNHFQELILDNEEEEEEEEEEKKEEELLKNFNYNNDEYLIEYNKTKSYFNNLNIENGEETFYLIGFKQKPNYYKFGMTKINFIEYMNKRYRDHGPLYIIIKKKCTDGCLIENIFTQSIINHKSYDIQITHGNEWFYTETNIIIIKNLFENILNNKTTEDIFKKYTISKLKEKYLNSLGNNNIFDRCLYCNKEFKHNQSYYRHMKYRCKLRPQQETNHTVNNTTNNNSNNNSNNSNNTLNTSNILNQNINLNIYGQETIPDGFLTVELLEKLKLCNGDLTKTYLLLNDELYLKNKKNNNIKYTNLQSEYCQILSTNNDWILKRLLEVMNERGVLVKNELGKELERIIEIEGIKTNQIILDPRIKQMQNMYLPMSKFEDNINEDDDDIKELYKKYQIELYNLKKSKKKINIH